MALRVSTRERGRTVVISVHGEVDLSNADDLSAQLRLNAGDGRGNYVVDLHDMAFIDSTGLSALVGTWKRVTQVGGNLSIAAPQPSVARVLRITDLDTLFQIYPSVEDACAAERAMPQEPPAPPEP